MPHFSPRSVETRAGYSKETLRVCISTAGRGDGYPAAGVSLKILQLTSLRDGLTRKLGYLEPLTPWLSNNIRQLKDEEF